MTLELFQLDKNTNILPSDGVVENYGVVLSAHQADQYFQDFLEHFSWENDEVYLYGKHFITERKVVWYAHENDSYQYSGSTKKAMPWPISLLRLKLQIEELTGHSFNSCLANLYEHGQQAMGWHSDDEASLGHHAVIASLSLGATRKMGFKHKNKQDKIDILLQHGQLLVMRGETQHYWKHCIYKSNKIIQPRINLTFRYFYSKLKKN